MLTTSEPEQLSLDKMGRFERNAAPSMWNLAIAEVQAGMSLSVEQDSYMDTRTFALSTGNPWMIDCANSLTRTAFTDIAKVLPRRPIHATQDGGFVVDPSAMEVNQPYVLDLPGVTVWAVKDDTGDVIFYSPDE